MKKTLGILAGLLLPFMALAGTNTVSYEELYNQRVATFSWNNASSTGTNDTSCVCTSRPIAGIIDRIAYVSCTSTGTTFNASLTDGDGADILAGWGATVATQAIGASYTFCPAVPLGIGAGTSTNAKPWSVCDPLTLTVSAFAATNAARTGSMKLYYHE